ncbi:MAG TPA: hypothetical protein VJN71_00065, partial [Nitrososphaerales archaeon]|nr:hypothetical protein [Nitrososphaerales archaeon]
MPLKRREDATLLTGNGTYVDDVKFPNMLYASFVRSSYAHARIKHVDLSVALKVPGVVFAISGEEIKKLTKPLPFPVSLPGRKETPVYLLAIGKVHYTGEPVAVVVAENRYIAEDAAEKVVVDYEPLEAVIDVERALDQDAPILYDGWTSNEMIGFPFRIGEVDEELSRSDFVIKEK